MRDTYIDPSSVDDICDRVMARDYAVDDLKESHYRTLVQRLGQLEAERDGLRDEVRTSRLMTDGLVRMVDALSEPAVTQ